MQHKTGNNSFFLNIRDDLQTLFLFGLTMFVCCFNVNKVFRTSKIDANKTLTNTNRIIKRRHYMHNAISAKTFYVPQSKRRHSKKQIFFLRNLKNIMETLTRGAQSSKTNMILRLMNDIISLKEVHV